MADLPTPDPNWALFLDFDGTLVELREHPDHVRLPDHVAGLVLRLLEAFDGAVAIVSGRSVADLERLLHPIVLPLAGLHGLERRDARGLLHRDDGARARLARARAAVADFVTAHDGLGFEDKGAALAIHFRGAPALAPAVRAFLEGERDELGDDFHLQAGKRVLELKPAGRDKGEAVRAFMAEPPFVGRLPVFVGDDRTDEDAFAVVNGLGGTSVRVDGDDTDTAARVRLATVDAAIAWLDGLPAALGAGDAGTRPQPGSGP